MAQYNRQEVATANNDLLRFALTKEQIGGFISSFVQVGRMMAVKAYEPTCDMVRLVDVKKWCLATFTDYKAVKNLIKHGEIVGRRNGNKVNSPIVYSKADIIKAIAEHKLATDMIVSQIR